MKRFAGFQHHVIRNVDDIVDGAYPGGRKSRTQPGWARLDFDSMDCLETDERAALSGSDADPRRIDDYLRIGPFFFLTEPNLKDH